MPKTIATDSKFFIEIPIALPGCTLSSIDIAVPFGARRLLQWWHLHVWLAMIHHHLGTARTPANL